MSSPNTAADLAMRAVDAGTDQQYLTTDGLEGLSTDLSDLLANVRHLCDRYGLTYGSVDQRAHRSYQGDLGAYDGPAPVRSWDSPESAATLTSEGVTVTITRSAGRDGAPVVFVDNDGDVIPDGPRGPELRIRLNDELVYEGKPYEPTEKDA